MCKIEIHACVRVIESTKARNWPCEVKNHCEWCDYTLMKFIWLFSTTPAPSASILHSKAWPQLIQTSAINYWSFLSYTEYMWAFKSLLIFLQKTWTVKKKKDPVGGEEEAPKGTIALSGNYSERRFPLRAHDHRGERRLQAKEGRLSY